MNTFKRSLCSLASLLSSNGTSKCPNGGLQPSHGMMALLMLQAVSVGHNETDPIFKCSAYAAQTGPLYWTSWLFPAAVPAVRLLSDPREVSQGSSDETTGLGQTGRGGCGALSRSLKRPFQELQMEDRGELRPRSLNSVNRTGGINQLGFESSQIIWRLSPRVPAVKSRLAFPDGSADNAQYVPACSAERWDPSGGGSLLTFPTSDILLLLHHKLSVQTEWFIWRWCFKSAAAVNPKDQSGLLKRREESSNN